jgi:Adenine specific DNA methylase Mod
MTKQRLELTWYNKDMALIPTEVGKYGYTWVDPSDPRYCETHTLIMDEYVRGQQSPKSDGFEYSERADLTPQEDNLLILGESGDVLEALTRVPELADRYVGKVKLIYIDPPFNTGEAFIHYEDNLEHSVWLTMMRDRLLHLRKLLTKDGSIWVHLDDVQVHRMRVLLDEVFGASNYVVSIEWEKAYAPSNNASGIPMVTDTILVYQASSEFSRNKLPRSAEMDSRYANPDGSQRGRWKQGDKSARHNLGKRQHPGVYGIQHPITGQMEYPAVSSNWRFEQPEMLRIMREWGPYELGEVTSAELSARTEVEGPSVELRDDVMPLVIPGWNKDVASSAMERYRRGDWPVYYPSSDGRGALQRKVYLCNVEGRMPKNLFPHTEVGHSDSAKKEIQALFPGMVAFSTPKPERLLERIIHIGSNPGDIVLDVFAGSGTTAAVAQKMGRRWVTCELLEDTFSTFTRPRLEKVINDQDPGGITRTKGERVAADDVELPEGVSPDDAAKFTSVLNKLIADEPAVKKSSLVKALKAASKTKRTKEVINWRGGGGFQVAHLSPACFDVDEELGKVVLTGAATGQTLIDSVTANLGFHLLHPDDDVVFEGRKGRTLLKVYEGIVDEDNALTWLGELQDGESLVIAALGVADGVNRALRRFGKGCRAIVIPDDLFCFDAGEES